MDKVLQNKDKNYKGFIKGSVIEKLKSDKFNAFLSRDLAKINTKVPLILNNGYELKNINQESLSESLQKLELSTLHRQIDIFNSTFSKGGFNKNNIDKVKSKESKVLIKNNLQSGSELPKINVKVINNLDLLDKLCKKLDDNNDIVALDTETNSINPIEAELIGIGFCLGGETEELYYIPIAHQSKKENLKQLSIEYVFSRIRHWIENSSK